MEVSYSNVSPLRTSTFIWSKFKIDLSNLLWKLISFFILGRSTFADQNGGWQRTSVVQWQYTIHHRGIVILWIYFYSSRLYKTALWNLWPQNLSPQLVRVRSCNSQSFLKSYCIPYVFDLILGLWFFILIFEWI